MPTPVRRTNNEAQKFRIDKMALLRNWPECASLVQKSWIENSVYLLLKILDAYISLFNKGLLH